MRISPHVPSGSSPPTGSPPNCGRPHSRLIPLLGVAASLFMLVSVGFFLLATGAPAAARPFESGITDPAPSAVTHASPALLATSMSTPSAAYHPNGSWVAVRPVGSLSPSPRAFASLVYDPVDRQLVLFGGWNPHAGALGDTWVYTAGTWTNLTANLSTAPSARWGANSIFDPFNQQVLLFGGGSGNRSYGDTWTFSHGTWTALSAGGNSSPSARSFAGLAEDRTSAQIVLFGGSNAAGQPMADTWAFSQGAWQNVTKSVGAPPAARSSAVMSYNPSTDSIILFGGAGLCGQPCGDTWSYLRNQWTDLTGTLSTSPSARSGATGAVDPVTGGLLIFGGRSSVGLNDTWKFLASGWTNISSTLSASPPSSYGSAAAFDQSDDYAMSVGGKTATGVRSAFWLFVEPLMGRLLVSAPVVSPGGSVVFTAQASGGVGPYQLLITPGDGSVSAFAAVLTHPFLTAGVYTATLTVSDSRGIAFHSHVVVTVAAYPLTVGLGIRPAVASPGEAVNFSALAAGGMVAYSYRWSGLPAGCVAANASSFRCSATLPGNYAVHVLVTDLSGNRATSTANLTVVALGGSSSFPLSPASAPGLIAKVGWSLVPAVVAAMAMSALAAGLMYQQARLPPETGAAPLPERPFCYSLPEWAETPDDFRMRP